MTKITAKQYWNEILKEALYETGYLPKELYHLITTSDVLATFITPSIIKSWYNQEDNLNFTINEISYTRGI